MNGSGGGEKDGNRRRVEVEV